MFSSQRFSNQPQLSQQQQQQVLKIGQIACILDRQIAEGGYARVFLARKVVNTFNITGNEPLLAIKRVNLPSHDKETASQLKQEVEIMKTIEDAKSPEYSKKTLLKFYDSQLSIDNKELFIAMEYCQFNLIQIMQFMQSGQTPVSRFNQVQVQKVFGDICEAVAFLHCAIPGKRIIHRDIKVENVLIYFESSSSNFGSPSAVNSYILSNMATMTFKLCDFGSCTTSIVPPFAQLNHIEVTKIEEEIERLTTLAYRAPEMLDLYRRQGISYKADIWALGVFLYKLCFFVTPFENDGKLAILNRSFVYPPYAYQQYSKNTIELIDLLLTENPFKRPNIYRVMEFLCTKIYSKPSTVPFPNCFTDEELSDKTMEDSRVQSELELQKKQQENQAKNSIRLSPPVAQRRGRVQKTDKVSSVTTNETTFNAFDTFDTFGPSCAFNSSSPVITSQTNPISVTEKHKMVSEESSGTSDVFGLSASATTQSMSAGIQNDFDFFAMPNTNQSQIQVANNSGDLFNLTDPVVSENRTSNADISKFPAGSLSILNEFDSIPRHQHERNLSFGGRSSIQNQAVDFVPIPINGLSSNSNMFGSGRLSMNPVSPGAQVVKPLTAQQLSAQLKVNSTSQSCRISLPSNFTYYNNNQSNTMSSTNLRNSFPVSFNNQRNTQNKSSQNVAFNQK